jgi:hypothetical protein
LGLYAQDEWAVLPHLKITLSLRAQHDSNPICQTNCFALLNNSFADISHNPLQPYNQAIRTGLHQAFQNYENISWEPRFGFAWQPFGYGKTVVRGGIGIFSDLFPALIATAFDTNPPLKNTFTAAGIPLTSAAATTAAANKAFVSGFNSGLNIAQIEAGPGGSLFSPPSFTNAVHNIQYPTYQEWNFEVQQALGSKMSLTLNYVGNHGSDLAIENLGGMNTYCNSAPVPYVPSSATPCLGALGATSFTGMPLTPLDPRFGAVVEAYNPGVSNYNGLTVSFTRHINTSFQVQGSYTWSHALDDVSNGRLFAL